MKALVTGGAGFMGAWIVDTLLRDGHDKSVVVIDDLSGGFKENLDMRVSPPRVGTFYEGSITDEGLVNRIFGVHKFDYVYHCAAYAAEGLSHHIRHFNYMNNLIGSVNLINASINHKVKCFVFMSSIAVYGSAQIPMTEDTVPQPEDPYGISKYAVELDLAAAHKMFDLNYIIFRPHNVYGPLQNIGDPYRNVVGIFMNQCLQGKPITIFGDGSQTRAFTYIEDIAPYLTRCIARPKAYNQTFNIGASNSTSVYDLANIIVKEIIGNSEAIAFLPARNEVKHAIADHSKFQTVFGTIPITPLKTGLLKTAAWVRQHGARQGQPFELIEVEKNMPPSWKELTCLRS